MRKMKRPLVVGQECNVHSNEIETVNLTVIVTINLNMVNCDLIKEENLWASDPVCKCKFCLMLELGAKC